MIFDTAGTYKYDAFISYNHADQRAARTIQHKLEKYRIPKAIRKNRKNNVSHLKVFLDETDLSAGNLEKNIMDALDLSAKLIVVCSSIPAVDGKDKYKWVTQEVQYFIDTGRSSDILPVVLDGNWDSLPPNMKDLQDNQFISDVSMLGKRKAFLKVLSAVLDTDFDELVKRANIRRNVKLAVMLAVFLPLALLADYYYLPHTEYYEDYVIQNGIPKGIGKLTRAERTARSDVFAITIRRSRHEIRLKHTNSAGLPTEDTWPSHIDAPVIAAYACLDDWSINTVDYLDENGKQLCTYAYAPDLSYVDLIKSRDDAKWLTTEAGTNEYNLPVRTGISRYNLEFSPEGFLSKRMYAVDRLSVLNEDGVGGEAYVYSSSGKLEKIIYLDVDGTPMSNKGGIASIYLKYNDDGQNYRVEYLDANGKLINNSQQYAASEKKYDTNFNVSEIRYYDLNNTLAITSNGYAIEKIHCDGNGFITSESYFDDENNRVFHSLGCHEIQFGRDTAGRETEVFYLDTDGHLILISPKYAKRITEYTSEGLVKQQLYFGTDGEPYLCGIGAHRTECTYDKKGNLIEISHYDIDGEPVYTSLGYASVSLGYNDAGMEETQRYFGVKGEPILGKDGYHKQQYIYNDYYNIEEIQYTGIFGQPAMCSYGYAFRILHYDNSGNILDDSYLDDYKQPTYKTGYYARAEMKYNERGNRESIEYFNVDGTPADNTSYSRAEFIYDDETGRLEEEAYYKEDRLINRSVYQYTNGGAVSSKTVSSGSGDSEKKTSYVYDKCGNEIEVIASDQSAVPSKTKRQFDERGNDVKESYYDEEDTLIRFYTVVFNQNGMPTKTCYYNGEGNLSTDANPRERIAVVVAVYNNRNQKTERRCYDENGNLLRTNQNGKEAYAVMKINYSKNRVETIYYDETEHIYQITVQEYDDYDREINRIYYDGDRNQLVRHEVSYNVYGRVLTDALYDWDDKLFADPSTGVAKIKYSYDDYNYMISEEFYDAEMKLVAPYGAYAKYCAVRENGRTSRIDYYGADGKLGENHDGYATEIFAYDDRGNETERSFFDANGDPVLLKWNFSRYKITYDETGNIKESKFFDTENREVTQVNGKIVLTEALINSVPQKILMFYGNDDSALMGQIEMKLKIFLDEHVVLAAYKYTDTALEEQAATDDEAHSETEPEKQSDSNTAGEKEKELEANAKAEEESDFSDREYIS